MRRIQMEIELPALLLCELVPAPNPIQLGLPASKSGGKTVRSFPMEVDKSWSRAAELVKL
jgi:hypothetical protein